MRLQPEPDNPVDNNAIVFVCQVVPDQWERIGYVVKEACDDVHEAINRNKILSVLFAWVRLCVYFRNPGWYARIKILYFPIIAHMFVCEKGTRRLFSGSTIKWQCGGLSICRHRTVTE